ncbi:hypothetical protein B0H19DRAFT_1347694 [Mycena capillaripes]|nr:hypothetical protein B0H19DRAFT_1347694 [Mycena capillaripes]
MTDFQVPVDDLGGASPTSVKQIPDDVDKDEQVGKTSRVETLKQQPLPSDKKMKFWTVYQKLADEFDNKLQKKYGNNLDTSLIFAGLLSAVSSAFIIRIQPQLQPDPNPTIQTNILLALIQNGIHMAPQSRPATAIVAAQSLLYLSLFSTLLAALLAVLGKQWLLHYGSVGEKGTTRERALERQRKVDGLRRWKFDLVMQMLPSSYNSQYSSLQWDKGLSFYLWTIHPTIVAQRILLAQKFYQQSLKIPTWAVSLHSAILTRIKAIPSILPQAHIASAIIEQNSSILDELPEPSPDIPAIIWALETSTDPNLVEAAAAIIPELQWPLNLNLQQAQKRLADVFQGCFDGCNTR